MELDEQVRYVLVQQHQISSFFKLLTKINFFFENRAQWSRPGPTGVKLLTLRVGQPLTNRVFHF